MQQYSTKLVNGFPRDANRRTVMQQRCNSITDPSILNDKKNTIEWFVYASGTHTSPNQSVLAYLICSPFLDSTAVKDRFNKKLVAAITKSKRDQIVPNFDTKWCPITTAWNNLNDCNLLNAVTNITLITLNDLTNVRHGTSRWYITTNKEDIWYFMAQHFALAVWKKSIDRIKSVNSTLCENENAPYFGEWNDKVPRCWFPTTYNVIQTNSLIGKVILNNTTIIKGESLLSYECNDPNSWSNIIWCGINDHTSTQSYSSMIYNELRFYNQFLAMYENISTLSSSFLVGNQIGLWREWQDQLINQIRLERSHQASLISNAVQVSINLISQFEAAYPLHIWLTAANEASSIAVEKYIKPWQNSIKFWMIDRLNTQKNAQS
jgi:hypothetical protein